MTLTRLVRVMAKDEDRACSQTFGHSLFRWVGTVILRAANSNFVLRDKIS